MKNFMKNTNVASISKSVPTTNKRNLSSYIVSERFNSISEPVRDTVVNPELNSISEPRISKDDIDEKKQYLS